MNKDAVTGAMCFSKESYRVCIYGGSDLFVVSGKAFPRKADLNSEATGS